MPIIGRSAEEGNDQGGITPDALEQVPWVTDNDRTRLTLYSSVLAAARAGQDWRVAAARLLKLNVQSDEAAAKTIWDAHLQRARWFWTRSEDRGTAIPDRSR